jgi:hypothetical protein
MFFKLKNRIVDVKEMMYKIHRTKDFQNQTGYE